MIFLTDLLIMVFIRLLCMVSFEKDHQDIKDFLNMRQYIFRKLNKSVLKTITLYLEDIDNKEVNFNRQVITFTLQLITI